MGYKANSSDGKNTFIMGLPRCGSMALSVIMNNDHCFAHHEGLDFEMFDPSKKWYDSFSYKMKCANPGKRYFCADITMSRVLFSAACEHSMQFARVDPADCHQILHIYTPTDQAIDSMRRLFQLGGKSLQMVKSSLAKNQDDTMNTIEEAIKLGFKVTSVHKEGDSFTVNQLTEIAFFVGALRNDLDYEAFSVAKSKILEVSQARISLPAEALKAMGEKINDIHRGLRLAQFPA